MTGQWVEPFRYIPDAVISLCGNYRYVLRRRWEPVPRSVLWLMLNPSTADATTNDATIRRCIRYTKDWGYGGLLVANLYALRSPYPGDLGRSALDPVGPENDRYINWLACSASIVVCAWGQPGPIPGRRWDVLRLLREHQARLHYLTLNRTGEPGHPLRLPATLKPTPWDPVEAAKLAGPGHGS